VSPPNFARGEPFEIALIAEHPEAVPVIEAGYKAEWDFWYGSGGMANARSDLLERSQTHGLPLGLVALRAGGFVGAIALAANAIPSRPDLSPCLIGLWVAPAHRNCGIGTALLAASVVKAGEMGFAHAYSSTASVHGLFQRAAWREIDRTFYKGNALAIFAADCAASPL
jgi:GNAT superfamily N-acetyltransferase